MESVIDAVHLDHMREQSDKFENLADKFVVFVVCQASQPENVYVSVSVYAVKGVQGWCMPHLLQRRVKRTHLSNMFLNPLNMVL